MSAHVGSFACTWFEGEKCTLCGLNNYGTPTTKNREERGRRKWPWSDRGTTVNTQLQFPYSTHGRIVFCFDVAPGSY